MSFTAYPAPWDLAGQGYIFIYRFPTGFVKQKGFVPDFLKDKWAGGLGFVMLVDYYKSNAGPYRELLFIPGAFHWQGKKLYSITKIYVSSQASVENGRANWGIPKEQADFEILGTPQSEQIRVFNGESQIANFSLKNGGLSFPISTALLPLPLVQQLEDKTYYTQFEGNGTGKLAKMAKMSCDPVLFPDLKQGRLLAAVRVKNFKINFPVAITE
jgi:hypothetical protein